MGGEPLNIDHGYSRNNDQLNMLWNLTEFTLVQEGWSLKAVLAKIVTSNWFARRAPSISQADTAYELHPILDPWVVADPSVPEPDPPVQEKDKMNGQGELVDRGRVATLMRQIAASLGWRAPMRYPSSDYPARLSEALGQGYSLLAGFEGVNFQSLLALEDEVKLCTRPDHAAGTEDYLDALSAAVVAFNAANPAAPITVGEIWSALKDRMIQDRTVETTPPSGLASEAAPKTELEAFVAFVNAELAPAPSLTFNSGTEAMRRGTSTRWSAPAARCC